MTTNALRSALAWATLVATVVHSPWCSGGEGWFWDDFERLDGPVDGWTTFSGPWEIRSGELTTRALGVESWIWAGDPPLVVRGNLAAELRISLSASPCEPVGRLGGLMFYASVPRNRWDGTVNGYTLDWIDRQDVRGFRLIRWDNGWPVDLFIGTPWLDEPPGRWRVEVEGDSIRVLGDDVPVLEVNDETHREGHFGAWAFRNGTEIVVDDVYIEFAPQPVYACFTPNRTSGVAPLDVELDAECSRAIDGIARYEWDFGDGGSDSGKSAQHTFSEPGAYDVALYVESWDGHTDTTLRRVEVSALPPTEACFAVSSTTGVAPLDVEFDASCSTAMEGIARYDWDFGDGGSDSRESVRHTFFQPGTYYVTLSVESREGSSDTTSRWVEVSAPPPLEACFSLSPTTGVAPLEVEFNPGCSTALEGIAHYEWDFGDDTVTTDSPVVHHVYEEPGVYVVSLRVEAGDGSSAIVSHTVEVCDGPRPRLTPAFLRGDASCDGDFDITDGIAILYFLFLGATPPCCFDSADVNDDGVVDISDASSVLGYLFLGDPPPPPPFPTCGEDPTGDGVGCDSFDVCPQTEPPPPLISCSPPVLHPDAVVLDRFRVTAVTDNTVEGTFEDLYLEPGKVVISEYGQGLLRRIVQVESLVDRVRLCTSPATLEDAFYELHVAVERELGYLDVNAAGFQAYLPGVTLEPGDPMGDGAGAVIVPVTLRLQPPKIVVGGARIELSGEVTFSIGLNAAIDIRRRWGVVPQLERFLFEPTFTATVEAGVEVFGRIDVAERRIPVGRLPFSPIVLPGPVVVTPEVECILLVEGTFDTGVKFGAEIVNFSAKGALEYVRETWQTRSEVQMPRFRPTLVPERFARVQGEVAIEPKTRVRLYGVAGPYLVLDSPFVSLSTRVRVERDRRQAEIAAEVGLRGYVGANVRVLGFGLADFFSDRILSLSVPLFPPLTFPLD
jgi:PKD repeat protein